MKISDYYADRNRESQISAQAAPKMAIYFCRRLEKRINRISGIREITETSPTPVDYCDYCNARETEKAIFWHKIELFCVTLNRNGRVML